MHILHGTWISQRLILWGEDTHTLLTRKAKRKGLLPYPYLLSIDSWLRYLDQLTPHAEPDGEVISLWLPSDGRVPEPSPEAQQGGMHPLDGDLSLHAFRVDAITLTPADAATFLLALPAQPHSFMIGSDLVYWQQALLLAWECLVEGRYTPAIEVQGQTYTAYWQPRPHPDHYAQFTRHMPPVCRAVVDNLDLAPEASVLLDDFLQTIINQFIRGHYTDTRRVTNSWLKALTGKDPVIRSKLSANRQEYEAWQQWHGATDGVQDTFKICFRLEEPQNDDELWMLTYLLQATDDPSLMVDAEMVWASTGQRVEYLERRFEQPQEKMLTALGVASRFFSPIERSLRTATPTHVLLTTDEALSFLLDAAPLLQQRHFAVLVPNWWGRQRRLKAKATVKGQANEPTGFLNMDNLAHYEWKLSVGGEVIGQAEFEELVALKQPLVRYKGEWVVLDATQVDSARKFFEQNHEGQTDILGILKMASTPIEVEGLEVEGFTIEGWLSDIFARLQAPDEIPLLLEPPQLKATLRPYQVRGFNWLVQMRRLGLGACLADDMGLGKSIQTISLWLYEREQLGIQQPYLLVCPTSVVGNWGHELTRFAPSLRYYRHQGSDRLKGDDFTKTALKHDVVITSYALLHRDLDTLQQIHWAGVVLDEAQNIKNPSTKQAQAARALKSDHRLALTGTPVENRLTELWSILHFLNAGYLGSQQAFRSSFSVPIERYGDAQAAATLKHLTTPFILRRLKSDPNVIQDLPEKFENKVYCSLTSEQATLYEAVVREELEALQEAEDAMQRRGSILRMLTRLKQVCNHPAHLLKEGHDAPLANRSGKLIRLAEMLDEMRSTDERALIFTQYAEMGTLLETYLQQVLVDEVLFLHGGTPTHKREEMIRTFQSRFGPPVFILSLKAGGTGLNLTQASHVFHFDRWYNPAVENQATDRAYRIGQTKNVQVHKFICLGTLEERIDELIEHKQALADQIVGEGESWLSELSNSELTELVTLRRDVLADA